MAPVRKLIAGLALLIPLWLPSGSSHSDVSATVHMQLFHYESCHIMRIIFHKIILKYR